MDEDRHRRGLSKVDHLSVVGNVDQSIVTRELGVGGSLDFDHKGSVEAKYFNSIRAHQFSIGRDLNYNTVVSTQAYFRICNTDVSPSLVAEWLRSLTRLGSRERHASLDKIAHTVPNTGDWILNDPTFIKWKDGNFKHLWCYGKPGVGKSVLAAKIIRRLRDIVEYRYMQDMQLRAVIYVYFDYQQRESQTPAALLADLLWQLLCQKSFVSPNTTKTYNEWRDSKELMNDQSYLHLLITEAAVFEQVYLILDGLDEYFDETTDENRPKTLMSIISHLERNFKVLVTSRDSENKFGSLKFGKQIHIRAKDQDLAAFFKYRIDKLEALPQASTSAGTRYSGTWSKRYEKFVEGAQGNFLHARLQMVSFERDTDQEAPENSQGDYSDFYEGCLRRIHGQQESNKKVALAALNWVCYAARPLSISELSHAVAGHQAARELNGAKLEAICAGLITVDDSDTVHLFHHTTHEFLRHKAVVRFQDSHLSLAKRCLGDLLERPLPDTSGRSYQTSSARSAYLTYAADHWGYHFRRAGDFAPWDLAMDLLKDHGKISEITGYMDKIPFHLKSDATALHISTFFDSRRLVLHSIDKLGIHIDAGEKTGHTATHWAAIFQRHRMLRLLLERGSNANAQDAKGRTPIHLAVSNFDESSTRKLLQYSQNLDLSLEDNKGFTPLRLAAREGHIWAIKLLLPVCGNIDAEDRDGFSALRWAFTMGHEVIVRLLIDGGANVNAPSSRGGWLILSEAAGYGNQRAGLVRFLLLERPDLHVELNRQDWHEMAPLEWAVIYRGYEVAYLLLKAKAIASIRDKNGRTLLHRMIENWSDTEDNSLLWLLIEHKCSLELRDHDVDWTPLQLAIVRGNMSASWLLIHGGTNLRAQDRQGQTPLHTAVKYNRPLIVSLLLDHGADCDVLDISGNSPLHNAVAQDNHPLMAAFLSRGKGQNVRNKFRATPLHVAVTKRHLAAIQFLLQNRADPDICDRYDRTPLHIAIAEKSREAVALLVSAMRQLDKTDHKKRTYLHLAAASGDFHIVETILKATVKAGIAIDQRDVARRTPLHLAIVVAQNAAIACQLVLQGADVNLQDNDDRSALHHAAELGDKDLIPTLVAHHGNVKAKDKDGKTPIEVAELAGHGELRWA
ncbi:nucleoside phosphorylase [Apiospora rasikravindrae]|uniref:Nucleoside phosphorylase n=1 Tax=Apiospora rasikravindrae TaxID=990691 RepID=A0ABR1S4B1_9PEZI